MRPPGFRAQPLSCATPARGSASLMTWDFAQRLRQTSRPLHCSPVRTWEPFRFGVAVLISNSLLCLLLCPGDCGLLEAPLVPQCQPWHRPPLRAGAQKTAAAWSRNEADCASGCKWLWAHLTTETAALSSTPGGRMLHPKVGTGGIKYVFFKNIYVFGCTKS